MSRDDLRKLLHKASNNIAEELVTAQATYYPNFIRVYRPYHPIKKQKGGFELRDESKKTREDKLVELEQENNLILETDQERSIRRTKKSIRDYVLCNKFEYLCTYTFATNRYDDESSVSKMSNWLKNEQKRKGKFGYLIVPERHKDEAIHYHSLMKDYKGVLTQAHSAKSGRKIPRTYNFQSFTHGLNTAIKIKDSEEDRAKSGNYLIKYITKDMPQLRGKNRYWASMGLNVPVVEDNPAEWYKDLVPLRSYETEFGIICDYAIPEALKHGK